jgi:hypothetical protein
MEPQDGKEIHVRISLWERLQAATGLVFVLLSLIALFALPTPPAAGASAKDIASYYSVHNSVALVLGYIYLLAFLFFLWFISYVRTVYARAEGETHHLSTLFFGAGVAVVVIELAFGGVGLALPGQTADLGVIKALSDVVNFGGTIGFLPGMLLSGIGSVLVLRTGALPRWVGAVGLVVAVVQFLGSLSLVVTSGFLAAGGLFTTLAFLGVLLWVLVVSIGLIVKVGSGRKVVGTSPATA